MADTKPKLKVREFFLSELERIARDALAKAPQCVRGHVVDIECLLTEGFGIKLVSFQNLARDHKTYAFIDTTGCAVFVDADLMDDVFQAKKYRFTLAEELAHRLVHTSLFAGCKTVEQRLEIEESLDDARRDRMEHNAKALAGMLLMPENAVKAMVEGQLAAHTDGAGKVNVDKIASLVSQRFDVNFTPAKRRLKYLGYHRKAGWGFD